MTVEKIITELLNHEMTKSDAVARLEELGKQGVLGDNQTKKTVMYRSFNKTTRLGQIEFDVKCQNDLPKKNIQRGGVTLEIGGRKLKGSFTRAQGDGNNRVVANFYQVLGDLFESDYSNVKGVYVTIVTDTYYKITKTDPSV